MKQLITLIILSLFIVVSCKDEPVPKPDNLLSKEVMAAILYDVTLINSIKGVDKKGLDESIMHYDSYVYKKHQTDSATFVESNNYYATNPDDYNEIYELVENKLKAQRTLVEAEMKKEQERRDSIQKAKKAAFKKNDTLPKPAFNEVKKGR